MRTVIIVIEYETVLKQARNYYDLALKNYYDVSYPDILPNQDLLVKAARLLHTVKKQGYDDHRWCGLLSDILWYMPCCSEASFKLTERAVILSPTFPNELLRELSIT